MASDVTAVEPSKTMLDSVWESIVTPGASSGLIATINAALLLQMLIFGYLLISGWYNVHIIVMIGLSLIMLLLFNWFVSIMPAPEAAAPHEMAAEPSDGPAVAEKASTSASGELRRRT